MILFLFLIKEKCFSFRSDLHTDLNELVRNSLYYSRLPHLPIECVELDGIPDTLPILIEEIYSPIEQSSTSILSSLKPKTTDEISSSHTAQGSSKYPLAVIGSFERFP